MKIASVQASIQQAEQEKKTYNNLHSRQAQILSQIKARLDEKTSKQILDDFALAPIQLLLEKWKEAFANSIDNGIFASEVKLLLIELETMVANGKKQAQSAENHKNTRLALKNMQIAFEGELQKLQQEFDQEYRL